MKILILGGTVFLGRHLVEAARADGHAVTLFHRGTRPAPWPEVETLRGDRDGDLSALKGRRWDAVVDTSGYVPGRVRRSAELLAGAIGHYTFVSTVSVYAQAEDGELEEGSPLRRLSREELAEAEAIEPVGPVIGESYGRMYGALKALCEQAATEAMDGRALNVRAGLLVGPHDSTDRFTYWPARMERGGEVLAPGEPASRKQLVDARDLAAWILAMAERGRCGTYNATGPDHGLTMESILEECSAATGANASLTWVADDFLLGQGVAPWSELPLWIPGKQGSALSRVRNDKALGEGLRFRPLAETILDTLTWDRARPSGTPRRAGLAPRREQELLARWHRTM